MRFQLDQEGGSSTVTALNVKVVLQCTYECTERDDEPYHDHKRRRFDKYRVIGLLLMFFGVSILTLGVFDIGWTTSRYGTSCQPDYSGIYNNLCSGNHVYVYVAAPLWGGALVRF
jgi:hypothetical protein